MFSNIFVVKLFTIFFKFNLKKSNFFCHLPHSLTSTKHFNFFLGYRFIKDPKRYFFFSQVRNWQSMDKNKIFNNRSFFFKRLYNIDQKYKFSYLLRNYYAKTFFLPNRDKKITNFFKLFYTWNGKEIAYFFHHNITFILLRLGVVLNFRQSKLILNKMYVYINGIVLTERWYSVTNTTNISFLYNKLILIYFIKIKKLWIKTKKKLYFLYWRYFNSKTGRKLNYTGGLNIYDLCFSNYWLSLVNKCFLTLTFVLWVLPNTFSKWYWYHWVNWLNFSTHTWKYLSIC